MVAAVGPSPSYFCIAPFQTNCEKATRIFFYTLSATLAGAAVAATFATLGLSITAGALIGGSTALISCLVIHLIQNRRSPLDQLRREFCEQRVIQAIDSVKMILSRPFLQLNQTYENHLLHHEITLITDQLRQREPLQRTWLAFLQGLHGQNVRYPDGIRMRLDLQEEINRLNQIPTHFHVEQLDSRSGSFQNDLDQLLNIERECFGGANFGLREALMAVSPVSSDRCVIAKKNNTNEILGFIWYREERDPSGRLKLLICEVARKANCPRRGIAEQLFRQVLSQDLARYQEIYLNVRESNAPARALYERMGFVISGDANWRAQHPDERMLQMSLRSRQRAVA